VTPGQAVHRQHERELPVTGEARKACGSHAGITGSAPDLRITEDS
jgi:hypothetical protein